MKDDLIRIRIESKEKKQIARDATASGFDSTSAYLLHLARTNRPRKKA